MPTDPIVNYIITERQGPITVRVGESGYASFWTHDEKSLDIFGIDDVMRELRGDPPAPRIRVVVR